MTPEAAEAIRIADKHLAGKSIDRRKALALDIQDAIIRHAGVIASECIAVAVATAGRGAEQQVSSESHKRSEGNPMAPDGAAIDAPGASLTAGDPDGR
jgi:hypothetical protein